MLTIFLNAFSILLILLLALLLKKLGLLAQKDGALVSKLVVYLTLPATILIGVHFFGVDVLRNLHQSFSSFSGKNFGPKTRSRSARTLHV